MASFVCAQDDPAVCRRQYEEQVAELRADHEAIKAEWSAKYAAALARLQESAQEKGELKIVLKVRDERQRFEKEQSLSEADVVEKPAVLRSLQNRALKSRRNARLKKSRAIVRLADKCIAGLTANREVCTGYIEKSLALATALVPEIGYDRAAAIAKRAYESGKTIREIAVEEDILSEDKIDKLLSS